ncbi:MAG: DUF493 domain-containing protein [Planctomycetota bacterium]|nr:DUF493 domain-containing protein [Planctomycetota bacterium]
MDKPEIEYPCEWDYRVIGFTEELLRAAVAELVSDEHRLVPGKESKQGKYISLCLTVQVVDESHRHALFASLKAHGDILFVL